MKRQMAGPSPHSDEARLVGNEPLSFELDLQNGVPSTSGDNLPWARDVAVIYTPRHCL